ncbi:leiomodin-2a [Vanacampus margaritifer]
MKSQQEVFHLPPLVCGVLMESAANVLSPQLCGVLTLERTSVSRRKAKTYEDVDENELLASLTCDELRQLEEELEDLQPDRHVPIGLRQKDQKAKSPTGTFDRDENCKNLGKGDRSDESGGQPGDTRTPEERRNTPQKGKRWQNLSEKSVEKADESQKEVRTECPGKKNSLKTIEMTKANLVGSDGASGNPIVIEEALEKVLRDDPGTSQVNLNNIQDVPQETLLRFAEALTSNTNVAVFSLANTRADDRVAAAISKTLSQNRSIRNLNIESNFVSGAGILALLEALTRNSTLVELRFHNQRHICGGKVEMEMVRLLRENTTLLKLGYHFDLPGPRMAATGILTRNQDRERQRRLQRKKEQSPVEASTQSSSKKQTPKINLHGNPNAVAPPGGGQPRVLEDALCSTSRFHQSKKEPSLADASHKKQTSKDNLHKNPTVVGPPNPNGEAPTRKIAEMVKQHEGSKAAFSQKKSKSNNLKNGANEKESVDILKELKNSLKPSPQRKRDQSFRPLPTSLQRSGRDDLMAAIRGSGVGSLKRVPQT